MTELSRGQRSVIILALATTLAVALARGAVAVDCSEQFMVGAYGVLVDDTAVRSGALGVQGFAPIYLDKRSVAEEDPETCRDVTPYDVFRLVYERREELLLAGCSGDFDGDARRDYALLLAQPARDWALPHVFLARGGGYRVLALDPVTDPYGFSKDRFLWPGPFCRQKPATGVFKAFDSETTVVGDVILVGWYGYVWKPETERFEVLPVTD